MKGTVTISIEDFDELRGVFYEQNREKSIITIIKEQYVNTLKHLTSRTINTHEVQDFSIHKRLFENILTKDEIEECKEQAAIINK